MTMFRPTLLIAALLLAGCATVAPTQGGTALPVPATLTDSASAGSVTTLAWRDVITESRLRELIDLALANNRDLRAAIANIDAARAQYRINEAAQLPQLDANAAAGASRSAADLSSSGRATTSHQLSVSLGVAAWELDLWGRVSSLKDAALASYLATEQAQRSVQASLIAETASAWLTMAADQQRVALAEQTLASRRESLALYEKRQSLGAASALEVATTRAAVETARGDLASGRAELAQDKNALRLLVGAEPPAALLPGASTAGDATARLASGGAAGDAAARLASGGAAGDASARTASAGDGSDATALVAVPAGLASSVLLQRADVRAAELTLQASQANVAAARAAMFPTIKLTASAGTASTQLGGLFAAGNGTWSFAPSISLPIFDGGSSKAAWQQSQAQRDAQLASYEKTIQTAFREVADALAQRASYGERLAAQQAQVDAYQDTLRLTSERQRAGAESSLAVLDAQRSLWSAQQGLITLQLAEQTNRLTLFKALGGA